MSSIDWNSLSQDQLEVLKELWENSRQDGDCMGIPEDPHCPNCMCDCPGLAKVRVLDELQVMGLALYERNRDVGIDLPGYSWWLPDTLLDECEERFNGE